MLLSVALKHILVRCRGQVNVNFIVISYALFFQFLSFFNKRFRGNLVASHKRLSSRLGWLFVAIRNKEKECLLDKKQRNLIATAESLDCLKNLLECANLAEFKLNFTRRGLFLGSRSKCLQSFQFPYCQRRDNHSIPPQEKGF